MTLGLIFTTTSAKHNSHNAYTKLLAKVEAEMDLAFAFSRTPLVTISSPQESLNARGITEGAISAWKFAKTPIGSGEGAAFVIHELPLMAGRILYRMNTYAKEAFDRDNLIIAPLGFALFALINIPFIDASGIVIRLCEIFMVDNGVGTGIKIPSLQNAKCMKLCGGARKPMNRKLSKYQMESGAANCKLFRTKKGFSFCRLTSTSFCMKARGESAKDFNPVARLRALTSQPGVNALGVEALCRARIYVLFPLRNNLFCIRTPAYSECYLEKTGKPENSEHWFEGHRLNHRDPFRVFTLCKSELADYGSINPISRETRYPSNEESSTWYEGVQTAYALWRSNLLAAVAIAYKRNVVEAKEDIIDVKCSSFGAPTQLHSEDITVGIERFIQQVMIHPSIDRILLTKVLRINNSDISINANNNNNNNAMHAHIDQSCISRHKGYALQLCAFSIARNSLADARPLMLRRRTRFYVGLSLWPEKQSVMVHERVITRAKSRLGGPQIVFHKLLLLEVLLQVTVSHRVEGAVIQERIASQIFVCVENAISIIKGDKVWSTSRWSSGTCIVAVPHIRHASTNCTCECAPVASVDLCKKCPPALSGRRDWYRFSALRPSSIWAANLSKCYEQYRTITPTLSNVTTRVAKARHVRTEPPVAIVGPRHVQMCHNFGSEVVEISRILIH
ncbi:hypothetical protein EAG_15160 [Camponotus floridanus]|uniref:Uncharacterized protein n=1 Tax=Camponotus floridanus TaxID=104421 RepID=E2AQP3_CAMFO|nr:hypothetical protein EAG_15160 [Camponotus floridanus]